MQRLVIAEKPSVAQSIAAALGVKGRNDGYIEGNGYIVSWCFGHLAELSDVELDDEVLKNVAGGNCYNDCSPVGCYAFNT